MMSRLFVIDFATMPIPSLLIIAAIIDGRRPGIIFDIAKTLFIIFSKSHYFRLRLFIIIAASYIYLLYYRAGDYFIPR